MKIVPTDIASFHVRSTPDNPVDVERASTTLWLTLPVTADASISVFMEPADALKLAERLIAEAPKVAQLREAEREANG